MKQYRVVIEEIVTYEMTVDADTRHGAEDVARGRFLDSENPDQWFDAVIQREYIATEAKA